MASLKYPKIVNLMDENGLLPGEKYSQNPFVSYILHIIPALLWPVLSILQFSTIARITFPFIHRFLGYTFLVLSFSIGISGLLLIFYELAFIHDRKTELTNPLSLSYATIFMTPTFIYYGGMAVYYAKKKNFKKHRNFIIRHVSVGYSVVVMRLVLMLISVIFEHVLRYPVKYLESVEVKKYLFAYSMWIAIVICAVSAELYIQFEIVYESKTIDEIDIKKLL